MSSAVLVTGANGFLGSHVVRLLVERGEHVKAFVRPGARLDTLRGLPSERLTLAYGDVQIEDSVYRALAGCSRLIHTATQFELWNAHPERILAPALLGTEATLRAAEQRRIERIVVTSSSALLGVSAEREPMDESHELNLSDPEIYVQAKLAANRACEQALGRGLELVRGLPTVLVGPGDWKPTPNGRLLLEYLQSSPGGRFPVSSGGVNLADVEDVARGHLLALDRGRSGERYLLGGENLTYVELFETLSDLTGLAEPSRPIRSFWLQAAGVAFELKARWLGGTPKLTARAARDYASAFSWVTSERAERELGYTHRPARAALARAVKWFVSHGYVALAAGRARLQLGTA